MILELIMVTAKKLLKIRWEHVEENRRQPEGAPNG